MTFVKTYSKKLQGDKDGFGLADTGFDIVSTHAFISYYIFWTG